MLDRFAATGRCASVAAHATVIDIHTAPCCSVPRRIETKSHSARRFTMRRDTRKPRGHGARLAQTWLARKFASLTQVATP
jgi:hypothetical protein